MTFDAIVHPEQPKIIELFNDSGTLIGGIFPANEEETRWTYYIQRDPLLTPHTVDGNYETAVNALIGAAENYTPTVINPALRVKISNGIQVIAGHAIKIANLAKDNKTWEEKAQAVVQDIQATLACHADAVQIEVLITVPFNPKRECEI